METCKISKELVLDIMDYLEINNRPFEERENIFKALDTYEWYEGENPEAIYSFHWDCGRMGELRGSFVATKQEMEWLLNCEKQVYFGEVLGKHSEVYGIMKPEYFTLVSDSPKLTKNHTSAGYNPFHYTLLGGKEEWEDLTIEEIINLENKG